MRAREVGKGESHSHPYHVFSSSLHVHLGGE